MWWWQCYRCGHGSVEASCVGLGLYINKISVLPSAEHLSSSTNYLEEEKNIEKLFKKWKQKHISLLNLFKVY